MGTSEPGQTTTPVSSNSPPHRLLVDVIRRDDSWTGLISEEALVRAAQAAFAASKSDQGPAEASLLLCDDREIRKLNRDWRGKDEPTNVLSFPVGAVPCGDAPGSLGDVALANETVLREARELGVPVEQHAAHLVVHGVLHLVGFDHVSENDAQEMEALETQVLADLGYPDPYAMQAIANGEDR